MLVVSSRCDIGDVFLEVSELRHANIAMSGNNFSPGRRDLYIIGDLFPAALLDEDTPDRSQEAGKLIGTISPIRYPGPNNFSMSMYILDVRLFQNISDKLA